MITEKHTLNLNVYDDELLQDIIKNIGLNIRKERLNRNLSTTQLSRLTNIEFSQIYKIENGQIKVGILSLIKILIALDIQPENILNLPQTNCHI